MVRTLTGHRGWPQPPRSTHRTRPLALIADASDDLAAMYEAILEAQGFICKAVSDGPRLIRYAGLLAPDVVLTDIVLPGADGWALLRRLKARDSTRHIPVVVLTGYIHPWTRQRALDAGCRFLTKPCDTAVLVSTLFDAMKQAPAA
jgi:CheY-like chemotaxis protein